MARNIDFSLRLADLVGSSKPAVLQRSLKISYQSAKNYLTGRFPHPDVLISISRMTGCSIHWLLTGEGEKFLSAKLPADAPLAAGQFEESVRRICVEVINELNAANHPAQPKTVRLQPSEVMSEKAAAEPVDLPVRRR